MPQKYQNEKSPILNGQKKAKTPGKVQKMSDFGGPTSIRPFENTLYTRLKNLDPQYEELVVFVLILNIYIYLIYIYGTS